MVALYTVDVIIALVLLMTVLDLDLEFERGMLMIVEIQHYFDNVLMAVVLLVGLVRHTVPVDVERFVEVVSELFVVKKSIGVH